MAQIVSITNQKGGVGKTTTAINLAAALSVAEHRVLLVDGDPQGNSTSGIGVERVEASIYDVLLGSELPSNVIHRAVHFPSLDVLPATPDLAGAEIELVDRPFRETILRDALNQVRGQYDFIIVDCPPSLGLLTVNMLSAADGLLIPLQCEYFALEGVSQLLKTVQLVQEGPNSLLKIFGILLTMYDPRLNLSRQVAADARAYFGELMFATVIPRNIRLAEAPSFGRSIIQYDISSAGASAYLALAHEFTSRIETNVFTNHALTNGSRSL
jgi:chromosome partitioning protein